MPGAKKETTAAAQKEKKPANKREAKAADKAKKAADTKKVKEAATAEAKAKSKCKQIPPIYNALLSCDDSLLELATHFGAKHPVHFICAQHIQPCSQ